MEKITARHGIASTPYARIYYKESGQGTPLLMLHGNAETHLVFEYYEKKLSREYHTILMDSRAHGRSKINPAYADLEFSITDMAGDVAALLDTLHIKSCILVGFSDGANIALEFASLFPSRTIAVIAVSGNSSPDGLILPARILFTGEYYALKAVTTICQRLTGKIPPALFRARQLTSLLCNAPMMTAEQLKSIQAPVLLIAGTRDLVKVSHSRLLSRLIPHAQLLLMKGATHTSMFIRKHFYLNAIRTFLRQL